MFFHQLPLPRTLPGAPRLWPRTGTTRQYVRRAIHDHEEHDVVDLAYNSYIPTTGNATDGPLLILHGLFGSKRNWQSLCKAFNQDLPDRAVYALDLRNHGSSPHAAPMTYSAMAADVDHFIQSKGLKNVALLGHSMGGKVAMTLALTQALKNNVLSHLIVADIAPTNTTLSPEFINYISLMQDIDNMPPGMIKKLSDADRILMPYEPDVSIRRFLLTNLHLPSHSRVANPHLEKARFALPSGLLKHSIPALGQFLCDYQSNDRPTWDGPTLVFRGTRSRYITNDNVESFRAFFPRARMEALDTGHWVHSERPNEFRKLVVDFLR